MESNEKICFFHTQGQCRAITVPECDGKDSHCKFYKTKAQHIEESDRAIDICREKGLCDGCKYMKKDNDTFKPACKKSDEV